MKYYVGIDLGGTNIKVGVLDSSFKLLDQMSVKTNRTRSADAVISDMVALTKQLIAKVSLPLQELAYIGVGSPGLVNQSSGIVEYSTNLDWYNVPLAQKLEQQLQVKILIENDANAAAFGEFLVGSGKGTRSMVAITLGTGVGGGIIVDGKILRGFNFAAGELGHDVIVAHGRKCACGREGCFETYASATGLITSTKEAMGFDKDSLMWQIVKGDLQNVNGRTAFVAMRAQDATATVVVNQYIDYLSIGIANVILTFQPEVLCIGGGISREGETLLEPLRKLVAQQDYVKDPAKRAKIVCATLRNDAGIIGSALLGIEP